MSEHDAYGSMDAVRSVAIGSDHGAFTQKEALRRYLETLGYRVVDVGCGAGEGDLVFFEAGKEAAQANPNGWFNPADAAIIGVVDAVDGGSSAERGSGKSAGARA